MASEKLYRNTLTCNTFHRRSTVGPLETYPLDILRGNKIWHPIVWLERRIICESTNGPKSDE